MASAPETQSDWLDCIRERHARQAGHEQITNARIWLRMLRHRDKYHRWHSERPDGEAWSMARARALGFGDIRSLEDLRCASHAMLARPPFEFPYEHPWWANRPRPALVGLVAI